MARSRRRGENGRDRSKPQHSQVFEPYDKRLAVLKHFDESGGIATTLDAFYSHLSLPRRETQRKTIYAWKKQ